MNEAALQSVTSVASNSTSTINQSIPNIGSSKDSSKNPKVAMNMSTDVIFFRFLVFK